MREFQDKKKFKKILYSKVTVVMLVILIAFFAHATWNVYKKEQQSAADLAQAHVELGRLTSRQQLLNSEINRLSTDDGLDEEIRSTYNVAKPGEHVLIMVNNEPATTSTSTPQKGWWGAFKSWFK